MAGEYSRTQRVGDYLRREVALIIQNEIRDPRVNLVSVTGADVSRDLSYAKIFVTIMDADDEAAAKTPIDVLNKAAGFIRSCLAKDSTMRTIPKIRFYFDKSVGQGRYMESLIRDAMAKPSNNPIEDDSDEN